MSSRSMRNICHHLANALHKECAASTHICCQTYAAALTTMRCRSLRRNSADSAYSSLRGARRHGSWACITGAHCTSAQPNIARGNFSLTGGALRAPVEEVHVPGLNHFRVPAPRRRALHEAVRTVCNSASGCGSRALMHALPRAGGGARMCSHTNEGTGATRSCQRGAASSNTLYSRLRLPSVLQASVHAGVRATGHGHMHTPARHNIRIAVRCSMMQDAKPGTDGSAGRAAAGVPVAAEPAGRATANGRGRCLRCQTLRPCWDSDAACGTTAVRHPSSSAHTAVGND